VNALTQTDLALCEAFVDGLLTAEERRVFERRLGSDPRLAAALRNMISDDAVLQRLQATDGADEQRVRFVRPWIWTASIAAGLSILAVLTVEAAIGGRAPRFEAGLAPSSESAVQYIDSIPDLKGLRPPGIDALQGGPDSTNVGATEFHVRASAAEQALIAKATATELDVDSFVIGLDLAGEAEVVVVAVPKFGKIEVLYPTFSAGEGSRLPKGKHVLPGPHFDFAGERIRYRPGFQLPVGAAAFDLLLCVRSRDSGPIDPAILATRRPADQVAKSLEDEGYEVRRLRVSEPKD
jgi:hypothetical protein